MGRAAVARSRGAASSSMRPRIFDGACWREARLLHVQRRWRSPYHAGEFARRALQSRVVRLIEAGEHEELQADGVAAEAFLNRFCGLRGVGDPKRIVGARRFNLDLSYGQGCKRTPGGKAGQGCKHSKLGFGEQPRPPGAVRRERTYPDAAETAGLCNGFFGFADLAQQGRNAKAQSSDFDRPARVASTPGGQMEGALGRKTVADQLPPNPHDQPGTRTIARSGEQRSQELGLSTGTKRKPSRLARCGFRRGHGLGEAGALDNQTQQVRVDGVDAFADLFE